MCRTTTVKCVCRIFFSCVCVCPCYNSYLVMCQFNVPDGQLSVQAPLCLGTVGQRTSALGARPLGSRSQVAPSLLVQLALLRRASDHLGRHPLKQVHTHTHTHLALGAGASLHMVSVNSAQHPLNQIDTHTHTFMRTCIVYV